MYPPVTPLTLGLLAAVLMALLISVEVGLIEVAYMRLGISPRRITALLMATIVGSYVNIPIARVPAAGLLADRIVRFWGIPYVVPEAVYRDSTLIAANVGGAVIPAMLSLYLLWRFKPFLSVIVATAATAAVVHHFSAVVPGVGVAVPTLIPGVTAAVAAYLLDRRRTPAVAYIAGTMGCLLGADIMNLGRIAQLHAPVASIGGAGTFDGVFVSGIVAVLLA